MGELTRLRVFELTKDAQEQYPVTIDFSDVISAYDKDAAITAAEVTVLRDDKKNSTLPVVLGYQIPAGSQRLLLGLGKGDAGFRYEIRVLVTTTIQLPGSLEFATFAAVVYVTVKG